MRPRSLGFGMHSFGSPMFLNFKHCKGHRKLVHRGNRCAIGGSLLVEFRDGCLLVIASGVSDVRCGIIVLCAPICRTPACLLLRPVEPWQPVGSN